MAFKATNFLSKRVLLKYDFQCMLVATVISGNVLTTYLRVNRQRRFIRLDNLTILKT